MKRCYRPVSATQAPLFFMQRCCLIVVLLSVCHFAQSASVYSRSQTLQNIDPLQQRYQIAMQAYLNGDYETAYNNWLEAAKKKHAKSQFNLALMHERQQIPGGQSSRDAALDLYKRSANEHYPPAYRYWARLVEKDKPELAKRILNALPEGAQAVSNATPQTSSVDSVPTSTSLTAPTDGVSSLNRESWIAQQPNDHWTVQIVAYRQEQRLLDFIRQHQLSNPVAYFREGAANKTWFKLIWGSFESKQMADQARANLPVSIRGEGPWLRQFKDVKTAIRQAN